MARAGGLISQGPLGKEIFLLPSINWGCQERRRWAWFGYMSEYLDAAAMGEAVRREGEPADSNKVAQENESAAKREESISSAQYF